MQSVAGKGQYPTDVSGQFEAIELFRRYHKPDYEEDLQANCHARLQAVTLGVRHLEEFLSYSRTHKTPASNADMVSAQELLGQLWSYQGDSGKAIDQFQAAYDNAAAHGLKDVQMELEQKLGIAEMRRGENDNCVHG